MADYGSVKILGNDEAPLVKVGTYDAAPAPAMYYGDVKILGNDEKPLLKIRNYIIAGATSAPVPTIPQWGQLWPRGDYSGQ